MNTTCDICGSANAIGESRCVTCGSALPRRPIDDPSVSPVIAIAAFIVGAIVASFLGFDSPLLVTPILGGIVGVVLVRLRARRGIDPVETFIHRAAARDVIDPKTAQRLLLHRAWEEGNSTAALEPRLEDVIPPPPASTAVTPPAGQSDVAPTRRADEIGDQTPPVLPPRPFTPPVIPPAPRPGPAPRPDWAIGLERFWETLRSDLAVHGLAYLGVLFVFVGVVGFVLFAFAGVGSAMRPVAEITVPVALFGSARFLRGSNAPFVAGSLELLGGLLTPVVVFAAFADGSPIPPDPQEAALIITLTLISLAFAIGYGWLSVRNPATPLRYLVAPLLWTAVGVVGLAIERGPSAAQFAMVAVAVAVTTWLARNISNHRIAQASTAVTAATSVTAAIAVAVPGGVLAAGLSLLFGATSDWPPIPIVVASVALIVILEQRRETLPIPWLWQLVTGVIAAVSVAQSWPPAPVAAGAALAALIAIEWWHKREDQPESALVALGVYALALLISAQDPGWLFGAAGIGFLWSQYRRIRPLFDGLTSIVEWGGAILPIATVIALRDWAGTDVAGVSATTVVVVAALAARRLRPSDFYLAVWTAGAATLLLIWLIVDSPSPVVAVSMAAGALLAYLASARGPGLGVWAPALAFGFLVAELTSAIGVDVLWTPSVLAGAGLLAVIWSARAVGRHIEHIGAAGHITGVAAMGWLPHDWWLVGVIGAFTIGVMWSIVADERSPQRAAPIMTLVSRATSTDRRQVVGAFTLVASTVIPIWLITIGDAVRLDEVSTHWQALVVAGWALLAGATTRLLSSRPHIGGIAAWSAFGWAVIGALMGAGSVAPEMITLSLVVATVMAIGSGYRRTAMIWTAWLTLGLLTVSIANHAGVAPSLLHRVALGWGSAMLIAGLSLRRRLKPSDHTFGVLDRVDLRPPIVLGAVAAIVGTTLEIFEAPDWIWITGAAAVAGLSAILAAVGAISFIAWALLTLGMWIRADELDWLNDSRTWPVAIWVGLLCLVTAFLTRMPKASDWWQRWDLPPFGLAHATGATGIVLAVITDDIPLTWMGLGIVSAGAALALRRFPWAIGATGLFVGASISQGGGWPTFTLLGLSVASVGVSFFAKERTGVALHAAAAGFALSGWGAAVLWRDWWFDPGVAATAVGAGVLAIGIAGALRKAPALSRKLAPWALAGLLAELAAVLNSEGAYRLQAGTGLAIGLALWAIALGLAATPLNFDRLREATALPSLGSALALAYSQEATAGTVALTAAAIGVLLALAGFWLKSKQGSLWANSVLIGSAVADIVAVVAGLTLLPEVNALTVALIAIGIKLLGAAFVLRSPIAGIGSVWCFAGAWLLFATQAAGGDPQWFAVPVGVALAATSDLGRWHRRRTGSSQVELAIVDGLAATLIVGPSVIQTIQSSVAYGLLVMVLGVVIVGWGIATRVSRRLMIGAGGVALGASLMVVLPLARVIPQFRGPALWATVIVLGVGLIGIAVNLEKGRSTVRMTIKRIQDLTTDWE